MAHELVDPEQAVAYGLFSRRQALSAGFTRADIEQRVRRGEWVRTTRGLLAANGREQRSGDALLTAALRAGPGALASHLSAAAVWGWDLLEDPRRPAITIPRNSGWVEVPDTTLFRRNVPAADIAAVGVLPLTCPLRTAIDIAADLPEVEAAIAIDSALRAAQFTVEDLLAETTKRTRMPKHPAVLKVLHLVDPSSGSVPESLARLIFRAAGLPGPHCQFTITRDGEFIGRVDFAWPEAWLVVEIDGFAWHSSRSAVQSDYERQRRLTLAGWTVLRFTADDVRHNPNQVIEDVRQALGL